MQEYLNTNILTSEEQQLVFCLRTRSLDLKNNRKSQYTDLSCSVCQDRNTIENEEHQLRCVKLISENDDPSVRYMDVFGSLVDQIRAVKVFTKVWIKRQVLLGKF